jgi:hypothetical protein
VQGFECFLQRKDMGNKRLQIEDSSAQACNSCRPGISVSVDELELNLLLVSATLSLPYLYTPLRLGVATYLGQ